MHFESPRKGKPIPPGFFKPKSCEHCGEEYWPSGARQKYCEACSPKLMAKRLYGTDST